jgi:Zn-dependent metalloprotease
LAELVDGAGGPKKFSAVDGLGPLITAINHYGVNWPNAMWLGDSIIVGDGGVDGNGSTYGSFASLDVIGHECSTG